MGLVNSYRSGSEVYHGVIVTESNTSDNALNVSRELTKGGMNRGN